jgi:hypothetical protein
MRASSSSERQPASPDAGAATASPTRTGCAGGIRTKELQTDGLLQITRHGDVEEMQDHRRHGLDRQLTALSRARDRRPANR